MTAQRLLVDIHTHVYLPRYASFLRSRTLAPRIFSRISPTGAKEERLLILDDEPSGGRPIGAQVRPFLRLLAQKPSYLCRKGSEIYFIVLGPR